MERQKLFNIYVDNVTMNEAIKEIDKLVGNNKPSYVITPNVDHIIKLQSDEEFRCVYEAANLVLVDGMPLIWASRLLKNPIKEKVSGSDLFPRVCELAANKGYRVFLLGAAEGIAAKAAENLKNKYPALDVCGVYSPKYGFENDEKEVQSVIDIVNESRPDILAIGLGAPKQEKFIYKYKDKIKAHVSLAIGASIDFEAGNVKRAPVWMQKSGLEWFYRLCKEPKRMFKRYIIDDMKIVNLFFKEIQSKKNEEQNG